MTNFTTQISQHYFFSRCAFIFFASSNLITRHRHLNLNVLQDFLPHLQTIFRNKPSSLKTSLCYNIDAPLIYCCNASSSTFTEQFQFLIFLSFSLQNIIIIIIIINNYHHNKLRTNLIFYSPD